MIRRPLRHSAWLRELGRAAAWIPGGAAFGFVCAFVILLIPSFSDGHPRSEDANVLFEVTVVSLKFGGLLGAVQLPIASLTILPKAKAVNALVPITIITIVCGVIPALFGLLKVAATVASIGFWGACAGNYRSRDYDRYLRAHSDDREFFVRDDLR